MDIEQRRIDKQVRIGNGIGGAGNRRIGGEDADSHQGKGHGAGHDFEHPRCHFKRRRRTPISLQTGGHARILPLSFGR